MEEFANFRLIIELIVFRLRALMNSVLSSINWEIMVGKLFGLAVFDDSLIVPIIVKLSTLLFSYASQSLMEIWWFLPSLIINFPFEMEGL